MKDTMKLKFLLWRLKRAFRSQSFSMKHCDINYINADSLRIARIAEKLLPYEESGLIDNGTIATLI